jgi:hypothetical protein
MILETAVESQRKRPALGFAISESLWFVTEYDFSRAVTAVKSTGPLGPEEYFSSYTPNLAFFRSLFIPCWQLQIIPFQQRIMKKEVALRPARTAAPPCTFENTCCIVLSSRDSAARQERQTTPAPSERLGRTRALAWWSVLKIP